jgi:NADPH2:quinone reductase
VGAARVYLDIRATGWQRRQPDRGRPSPSRLDASVHGAAQQNALGSYAWQPEIEELMKRVQAEVATSLDGYRIVDAERPSPGPTEVLVRIAACGVGYVDALLALGRYQVKPTLPHTPGHEVAGWVEAVGASVEGLSVGDRVLASGRGGFAEFAIAPAALVHRIPEQLAFGQAAGFRINYLTALHAFQDRARLQAGDNVLVLGAAGGLGGAGVQVAHRLGARVIAAASTPVKQAHCRSLGADEVIDTALEGWRERLRAACGEGGLQVVFDPVCGPLFEPAFRSLGWGGRHLVLGFVGGPIPSLPANLPLMKGAALVGVDVRQFQLFEADRAAEEFATLMSWVADGGLQPLAGREFPLGAFRDALEFALSGQAVGKTVLRVVADEERL